MYISLSDRGSKNPTKTTPTSRVISRVSSTVILLGVVSMLTDISSESVSAILPLYLTSALGLTTIAYGFIDGLYQGVSAVVRIGGGWAADRTDQPKWIAFLGYGVSAAARIWLVFATGFASLTAVITLDRLGKGVRTAPRDALITASSAPANLGHSFGVHRMLDTVGAAVGPLLAFVILAVLPSGYSTVFVVSLAFAAVGVLTLGLVVPNIHKNREARAAVIKPPRMRWRDLATPRLRRLLAASAILSILTIGDGFIYLVLQARDSFAAQWFPLLYVGTNVAFLLLAIPLGRLADRIGRARVFVLGHLALLAVYVLAAVSAVGLAITLICLALLGVFYAATDGVLSALASQFASPESTASGIASAQTVVALTRMVASFGFGILWFAVGHVDALVIVAALFAVAIAVAAVLLRPMSRTAATP